jgi:hypothetical protein
MLRLQEDEMSTVRGGGLREAIRGWLGRGGEPGELQLDLARDAAWSAEVGRGGLEVRCARGALLVTVEGDPVDHELSPGEAFVASRRGRLVAWALEPARLVVRRGSAGTAPARRGDGVAQARRKMSVGT